MPALPARPSGRPPRGRFRELDVVDYFQKPLFIDGWIKHHGLRGVRPRIRAYGANLEHVLEFVRLGVGGAVVPRHAIEADLETGRLVEHGADKRHPWIVKVWLNQPQSEADRGVSSLIDLLR
jgi:DNA-binding transcriptional LysR family regulator